MFGFPSSTTNLPSYILQESAASETSSPPSEMDSSRVPASCKSLRRDLHSAVGDQEGAVCLYMSLHTIMLRMKLLHPVHPCSNFFPRTPLRSAWPLFSQLLDLGTLTLSTVRKHFLDVSICQCRCTCRLQIVFPTVNFLFHFISSYS